MLLLIAIFVAHLIDEDEPGVFTFGLVPLFLLPMMLTALQGRLYAFFYYTLVALGCLVYCKVEYKHTSLVVRRALTHFWVISGALLTLSRLEMLRHPVPLLSVRALQMFLDIRLIFLICFASLYAGVAVVRVASLPRPDIRELPDHGIEPIDAEPGSVLNAILRPVSVVVVIILGIAWSVAAFVWKVLAEVGAQLSRFARTMVELLIDEVFTLSQLIIIAQGVVLAVTPIFVFRFTYLSSPTIARYLNPAGLGGPPGPSLFAVGLVAVVLAATWIVVGRVVGMSNDINNLVTSGASCVSILMLALAACGLLTFFVAKLPWLDIEAFAKIGLFTILMLMFLAAMFLYHGTRSIGARILDVKRRPRFAPAERAVHAPEPRDSRMEAEFDRMEAERRMQAEIDRMVAERRMEAEIDRMVAERRMEAKRRMEAEIAIEIDSQRDLGPQPAFRSDVRQAVDGSDASPPPAEVSSARDGTGAT
jgi:hypothetical protein